MAGYYELLRSAVESTPDLKGRLAIYNRARHAFTQRMRTASPPVPDVVIESEQSALEAAIHRIEAELFRRPAPNAADAIRRPKVRRLPMSIAPSWFLSAVAVLFAGMIVVLAPTFFRGGRQLSNKIASQFGVEIDDRIPAAGASEPQSYVYGRQLTYYRTTHPAGTIIIDKSQRFLYLVKPNVSAVRYGIGVGRECLDLPALMRVTRKADVQSGPENENGSLGARLVFLDSNTRLIHGTNRPDTIGHSVWLGCVRLMNDDVIQLYDQTAIGGRVVVTN